LASVRDGPKGQRKRQFGGGGSSPHRIYHIFV
jgi:hypothetical protein